MALRVAQFIRFRDFSIDFFFDELGDFIQIKTKLLQSQCEHRFGRDTQFSIAMHHLEFDPLM